MRFRVSNVQGNGFTAVAVEHNGVELEWSARAYSKVKLADPNRVFKELNEYLETVDPQTHGKMFQSYEEIHKLFRLGYDPSMIAASLVHHMGEISKCLPMGKLRR